MDKLYDYLQVAVISLFAISLLVSLISLIIATILSGLSFWIKLGIALMLTAGLLFLVITMLR